MRASRNRSRRPAVLGALSIAGLLVVACTPFGASEQSQPTAAVDASGADGNLEANASTDDGGLPLGDAEPLEAGGGDGGPGPGTCFDFTKSEHAFNKSPAPNEPTQSADGFTLVIGPNKHAQIYKNFSIARNITKSVLTMVITASLSSGTWAPTGYIDLFAQYLGSATSYDNAPAMEIELKKDGSSLDVNVWPEAKTWDQSYNVLLPSFPTAVQTIQLKTTWGTGKSDLSFGTFAQQISAKATTTPSKTYTVAIGGGVTDATPALTLVVKGICISLE